MTVRNFNSLRACVLRACASVDYRSSFSSVRRQNLPNPKKYDNINIISLYNVNIFIGYDSSKKMYTFASKE